MSGKAYTMREMKAIVEYLTDQKAFREIKGRKMWMDYANSNLTTRTWQSLKETFLKRILPDITNPYYKLTVQQVASFQQGCDLEAKINNRLEIQTLNDDSSSNDTHNKDQQMKQHATKDGNDAGEDLLPSKINRDRSSTDTVIIAPCYNTAEDIQKELESSTAETEKENSPSPIPPSSKSIRDYITYSEPLTPMLQEVMHDFASDPEGDEPQMQIVEYPSHDKENDLSSRVESSDNANKDSATKKSKDADNNTNKDDSNNENIDNANKDIATEKSKDADNNINKNDSNNENIDKNNTSENLLIESNITDSVNRYGVVNDTEKATENSVAPPDDVPEVNTITVNNNCKNNQKAIQLTKSQNNSNSTIDTLPNNQEAFQELHKLRERLNNNKSSKNLALNDNEINTRKRSKPREIENMSTKKRHCSDNYEVQKPTDVIKIAQNRQSTAQMNSKGSKTQIKHLECVKVVNHNSAHLLNTDKISEKHNQYKNLIQNDDILHISDSSLSETRQIQTKTNEEDASIISGEKRVSRRNNRNIRNPLKGKRKKENYSNEVNDVLLLNSRSDSTTDANSTKKSKASLRVVQNKYKDRALANVFGFSSGVKAYSKKHKKNRKRSPLYHRCVNTSSSSDWTSDTGSDYVSPPRGRKHKQTRKYLKPKSGRILSLEEEGGLFVMYGKKIYPVVKDGKIIKNYLNYTPDHDSEDDESYWKLKYVKERKKTEELTKLLQYTKDNKNPFAQQFEAPQAQTIPAQGSSKFTDSPKENNDKISEPSLKEPEKKTEGAAVETLKIKITKQDNEIQVEGHWPYIHPILEQMMHIIRKEPESNEKPLPASRSTEQENVIQIQEPAKRSPVPEQIESKISPAQSLFDSDEDLKEKVNEREEQIAKEIEERANHECPIEEPIVTNVVKRKLGRPKFKSLVTKKPDNEVSEPSPKKLLLDPTDEKIKNTNVQTRQRSRPQRKTFDKEAVEQVTNEVKMTTRNSKRNTVQEEDPSEAKNKLDSTSDDKNKSTKKTPTKQKTKRRSHVKSGRIFSSPDNISTNSIESSLGYQESDESDQSIRLRKKWKVTYNNVKKGRCKVHQPLNRKTYPYQHEDISSDSNISFVTAPFKSSSHPNSSSNSEVYRSESYQNLFPQRTKYTQYLDMIVERSPTENNIHYFNKNNDHRSDVLDEKISLSTSENNSHSPVSVNYLESSGHVSLPLSPVLSVVEKLTLSKSELDSIKDIDIPNDKMETKKTTLNKYTLSDVDMSVPLMEQEYGLQKSNREEAECHLNVHEVTNRMSDSLLNKIYAVNIAEPTLSESIHQKLKNLLLESAKKIAKQMKDTETDNVNKMEICEAETQLKSKSRKRCSTPRKRQGKQNLETNKLHVEEEHTESYERDKTRPPPILIVTRVEDDNVASNVNKERKSERLRKKKDVIKVKILKPKKKEYCSDSIVMKETKASLQADSGINDTESGVFLQGLEDSVDLIHNHSDTCLHANECIGDSVEIIEGNEVSVLSLNSNSGLFNQLKSVSLTALTESKLLDICCENAQDAGNLRQVTGTANRTSNESGSIIFSPTANISGVNSLLTDDLSGDSPKHNTVKDCVSKWYLLSEDEASNIMNADISTKTSISNVGCGAHLQEIFPITCAVPDLSTITEENTTKFNFDGNTRSEFDSQS